MLTSVVYFEQCHPVAHQWDPIRTPGSCWSLSVLIDISYLTAAYSAFLDLLFAIYPQYLIAKLNMGLRKKIAVGMALGLSGVGCVVSIYKMTIFNSVNDHAREDLTSVIVPLALWPIVETDVLLISASLATLGPFVRFSYDQAMSLYSLIDRRMSQRSHHHDLYNNFTTPENGIVALERGNARAKDFHPLSLVDEILLVESTGAAEQDGSPGQGSK